MNKRIHLSNARIIGNTIYPGGILIEEGKISEITEPDARIEYAETIDCKNSFIAPGLIELHTHGGAGYDFLDGTEEAFIAACNEHLRNGVTTIQPTLSAADVNEYQAAFDSFLSARSKLEGKQNLMGIHLEGPFFPVQRAGGMLETCLRQPTVDFCNQMWENSQGNIVRWSAAPELPGAMEFGDWCQRHNILPSIAHSDAGYDVVKQSIKHGFRHVTHLYSDMSTVTRCEGFRIPGVIECAFTMDELDAEVISDGCHIPPDLYRMVYRIIGPERIQICSDSTRPAGTKLTGKVLLRTLGKETTEGYIEDGVFKMLDRSAFHGSIMTGMELIKVLVNKIGIPLERAIQMMTENPARIMGIGRQKGRILPGMDADLVVFDGNIDVSSVYCKGNLVLSKK